MQSPWDTPPALVAPRRAFVCPRPPDLLAGITAADYYRDSAHSRIDPARLARYRRAVAPLHRAVGEVVAMADRYRRTGAATVASCAARWLDHFAATGALEGEMSSNQAVYVQGWMEGALAIAWLKIRPAIASHARAARVSTWLAAVAEDNRRYYAPRAAKTDARNNHRAWAGLAAMATGIAADRRDLFAWGIKSFDIVAAQVTAQGTLPLEMARRSLALHYHLFAVAPLVTMAELAASNGLDLYARKGGALVRLVDTTLAGLACPSRFARAAGTPQAPQKTTNLAWAVPFLRRFFAPHLAGLLGRPQRGGMLYLGGLPP